MSQCIMRHISIPFFVDDDLPSIDDLVHNRYLPEGLHYQIVEEASFSNMTQWSYCQMESFITSLLKERGLDRYGEPIGVSYWVPYPYNNNNNNNNATHFYTVFLQMIIKPDLIA